MPKQGTYKSQSPSGVMDFAVDAPELPPFKPVLQSILRMAFTAGLQVLESRGQTMEAIKSDQAARSRFIRGCHRGYDKAQQRIGSEVIALQHQIENAEAEAKELRQRKDPGGKLVRNRIVVLRNRQLALRRIVDSLLHVITHPDTWILRRLIVEDRVYGIDSNVVKRALSIAEERNRDSRLRFSLVSDLSTIVHIGDLVERSFVPGDRKWKIIELKEGRMNEVLSGILDEAKRNDPEIESHVMATLGKVAAKQVSRIQRQTHRMREVRRIMTTDSGSDPRTNVPIMMTPDPIVTEDYKDAIGRVVDTARARGFGGASLPGGVHLVGLRRDHTVGDYVGALNHTFFHMRYASRPCRLTDGIAEAQQELREMKDGSVFVDLVAHSMYSQWGTPVYLWLDHKETPDLVMGDIRVFAQFDALAFFALAAEEGIKLSWVTGKLAERLKKEKMSHRIPGSPNAWGINAILGRLHMGNFG